ncbi:Terpene synthase [Theobroma cacao]|nr:Terpene synthase [Theobroma cacao]
MEPKSVQAEEYLEHATVTTGAHVALAHAFFVVDQGITKRKVDPLVKIPGIISTAAAIVRLWDDLGSAKDENQEGRDGSYVNLFIKEHLGISVQGAREHVVQIILDAWKRLNQRSCSPNPFSPCFAKVCLNGARMAPLMYNYDEHQNLPALEEHVKSMLLESFPIWDIYEETSCPTGKSTQNFLLIIQD